jgi:hypothetical protein
MSGWDFAGNLELIIITFETFKGKGINKLKRTT